MRGMNKKIQIEIKRSIAFLLVICMLPLSSFPAKAVQVEEIPTEVSGITEIKEEVLETSETDIASVSLDPEIREQSIGDMTVSGNWVLEEDTVVDELVFNGEKIDLNGYTLTVCEDLILEKGCIRTYYGDLIVWGDFRVQTRVWNEDTQVYEYGTSESYLNIENNASDPTYIMVAGDMYVDSEIFGRYRLNGILELKGNLYQKKIEIQYEYTYENMDCDFNHQFILSGDEKQIIQWTGTARNQMGSLYIRNNSEEGIVFDGAPLVCNQLEMTKGQKVTGGIRTYDSVEFTNEYFGGDIEIDHVSFSSYKNVEIAGDLILIGSLSVAGNVTVSGDLIVKDRNYAYSSSAYLNLSSGGNFHVKGKLDATQTTKEWVMSGSIGNTFRVDGDALADNIRLNFSNGARFEVGGNLNLMKKYYFSMTEKSALVFCGDEKQEMLVDSKDRISLRVVEILNTSEEGVHFNRDDIYIETINTNGNHLFLAGKEVLEPFTLTEDTTLTGDYYMVGGTLDLNGHMLVVDGNLEAEYTTIDINGGTLHMNGDLTLGYLGLLQMDGAEDKVYVDGKLAFFSAVGGQNTLLTAGELVVYGDFETYGGFKTEEKHITRIFRKNYADESNQTIRIISVSTGEEMTPAQKLFAHLYISRKPEIYYTCAHSFEDLAENLYYYGFPEESPTQVTGLTVSDAGYSTITIRYDAAIDDVGIAGYEIYRDGVLVKTTEETYYTDTGLSYHTEYEYQVYAFDVEGNKSPSATTITASTIEDVIPPEKVEGLKVTKQSPSEVRLSWNPGLDNNKVAYYKIYRDGELIKEKTSSTSYADKNVEGGKVYEYQVTAVDLGENESEKSDSVTARVDLPEILAVTPAENTVIGGDFTSIGVTLRNHPLGSTQYLTMEYYNPSTGRWVTIRENQYISKYTGREETKVAYPWYHSSIEEDGDIKVRYIVKDEEGNKVQKSVTYHLDRTGPIQPEMITLSEENTNVTITWTASESEDAKGYRLYGRKQGEARVCLANIEETGKETYSHVHRNLEQDETYEYYVESYDLFGNTSITDAKTIRIARDTIAPTPPTDVTIRTRSGSAVTLGWNGATDNVAVTAYNLYRNGELVAQNITGFTYKDAGLKENTLYTYHLTALDVAGNESEKSEGLDSAVCMPEILEMSPEDYEIIGGENVTIEVRYKDHGNSTGNTVELYWYDNENQTWNSITIGALEQKTYKKGILRSYYTWTLPTISKDTDVDVDVKAVLTDVDGNTTEQTVTYTIDKTAPTPPAEFEATENNGIVVLTYAPSSSVDTEGYILYRKTSEEETYTEIARISGRATNWYQDKTVETGVHYMYRLTAYDIYGLEGSYVQSGEISVSEDDDPPSIKSMTPQAGDVNKTVTVCVEGSDNRAVTQVNYYIRKDDETEWTFLAEVEAVDNKAEYAWDTTTLIDETYYIKAVAKDAAGNENENLYQRRYKVDNTGIAKIQLVECTPGSTMIQITWEDVTEEDFAYFHVEQKVGDTWLSLSKVKDKLGYVATGLKPETSYTFRVTGYDQLGNAGEPSDEVTLATYADTIAPSIVRIDPVSSYYGDSMSLSMKVKDNAELAKGVFSYSTDGETYTIIEEVTVKTGKAEETIKYTWDTSGLAEGSIKLRFEVYDTAGNHNQLLDGETQVENTYVIDHTSPSKMQKLTATGEEGYVGLTWNKSDETDIKTYRIYRSDSRDGEYVLLEEQSRINYYDTSALRGQMYYYKISAVDIAGNESELSDYACGTPLPDTTAPVITGISPESGEKLGSYATFSVLATDNAGLASVRLEYRENDSEDLWQELAAEEADGRQKYLRISFDASELSEDKEYAIRAVAYDSAGNASEYVSACYTFDLTAPAAPEIVTESMSYRIGITISGNTASDFERYEIYRKALGEEDYKCIQSTQENNYEDTTTKVNTIYYYKVRAYDIYGNYSESAVSHNYANDVDTIAPVAVLAETYTAVTGFSIRFDGTQSSDNVRIVKYEWDFGDGTKKTGAKPVHTYKKADVYTISLTVTDAAGNQSSTIATIRVFDHNNYGQTALKVIDEDGAPIAGAHVYIKTGNSDTEVIRTRADANGDVNVVTKAGVYEFAAYAEGYLPKEDTIRVSNYEKLSQEILLQKGEVVSGKMTATRMTLEELVEYGVDLSNPENYNTFTFRVELKFEETPLPVICDFSGVGIPAKASHNSESKGGYYVCKGNGGGREIQAICRENEAGELEVDSVVYLSTTQSVSWLKDMYNVQLTVINNADSSFPIEQASATLSLPEGLSLAETKSGQTLTTQFGTIEGQTSADTNWVVRGDASGTYSLSAAFHGILMPFEVPIDNIFATEQDFEVKAGEGMKIIVQPEDSMYLASKYYIQFKIRNESDRDFYNLSTTLGEYIEPAQTVQYVIKDRVTGAVLGFDSRTQGKNYHSSSAAKSKTIPVLYAGDTVEIGVFSPGEEICCTYVTDIEGSVNADHYYKLVDSFVETLQGANLGVEVSVEAIPSHLSRYIYYMAGSYPAAEESAEEEETYGDPVDVASGAFTQQINALSITGASTIELALNYNSLLADSAGESGYGWSHSYEQTVKDIGGVIELRSTPYNVASFVNEELSSGVMYGYRSGSTVILDEEAEYLGTYVATGAAMKGAVIEKKKENNKYIYVLTDMSGTVSTFDQDGKLIACEDKSGKSVTLSREEDKLTVTDDISGEKLVIAYDDGKVSSVSDAHNRKCSFTYDSNGNLTGYEDAIGNQTTFAYDDAHHMTKCTDAAGVVVVENTYDDKGRTLTQIEAGSDKKSVFTYEEKESGGLVTKIEKRDGSKLVYESDEKGNIIKETDEIGDVTEYLFDHDGNVLDEIAPDGSRTMYEYDEVGNMTASYDTAGNATVYTYDTNHNPVLITSADGLTSKYEYNDKNQMTGYTTPLGVKTTYVYDEDGNLTSESTPGLGTKTYTYQKGRKVSGTDYNGNKTTFAYDAYGNMALTTDALGNVTTCVYDAEGNVLSETDANGVTTTYTYDKSGNQKTKTIGDQTVHYNYDEAGRLTKLTNAMGDETLYVYDSEGNLISITYPDKTKSSYVYDAKGRVVEETYPDGSVHTYVYDSMGFLTQETHAGIATDYTYYPNGKLRKEIYADGTSYTYTYDVNWNIISVMDQDKNTTTYTYDAMSHVTSVTDALGNQVAYTYDVNGRRIKETDARGYETHYVYDGNGNCVKKATPDGTVVEYTYDGANNVTKISAQTEMGEVTISYKYDAIGRLTETTDALGNVTKISYDMYGNVWKVTDAYGNIVEENTYDAIDQLIRTKDGVGNITTYSYDKSANITKATMAAGTENANSYVYSYDKMGRILTSTDPLSGKSSYTYNGAGQVTSVTDPMGGVTTYEYDSLQRVAAVVSPIQTRTEYRYNAQGLLAQETNARSQDTQYTYDAIGRITQIKDELGTIRYTYDENGNILTVSETQGLLDTKEIKRTYDCMNRVTSYTDYNGNTITYGYDELGNRISLTYPGGEIVRYSYDKNGKLLSVTDPDGAVTRYEYDKNGRMSKTVRPNGSSETYTYDTAGNLTGQKDVAADGSVLHHYTYKYDPNGNITEMTGKGKADYSLLKNAIMTYDADNRLVTYNGEKVTYDADGNMLHGPLDGQMADFTYDCRNRLIKVETEDGTATEYEYDAENTRISETDGERKRVYVTDVESTVSQLLTETVYSKNLLGFYTEEEKTKLYVYGAGLISEQTEFETLYYHYNNIGSTTEITSDEGNIVYRFVYGTYGELLGIEDETGENLFSGSTVLSQILAGLDIRFLYNGQLGVQTDANGLYYMRARYYNTDIKRFINRDVVNGSIENSQSLNKYCYVQGNPVSLTDPFGLAPVGGDTYSILSTIGHTILDVAGIFFDGADLINAFWYAAEGNTFMAATCALSALPVIGSMVASGLKVGLKASKAALKAGKIIKQTTRLISHSAQMTMSAIDSYYAAKDFKQARANGESGAMEGLQLGLSLVGTAMSAGGVVQSAKGFKGLFKKNDNPVGNTLFNTKQGMDPKSAQDKAERNCGKQVMVNGKMQWQCFVAGTLVKTEDGNIPIEDIEPGDKVYAKNTETGEEGYKEVVRLFVSQKDTLVQIIIDDEQIDTTSEHPFWVDGKGFVEAQKLSAGDQVLTADGELKSIVSVEIEKLTTPVTVYNFEVKDWHTYYVSEEEILVHNECVVESGSTTADIYSFGNKSAPRGARPKQDFNVENFDSIVGPETGPLPKGASNVLDVNSAPLSGHYHMLPAGTQMPDGLDIIADGIDVMPNSPHGVGHHTIFPTRAMTVNEFNDLYKSLPWQYGGKK